MAAYYNEIDPFAAARGGLHRNRNEYFGGFPMHDPLIDDFTPADDLDALAAYLELGADQLALYRATRNRAKRGGKQNNAARPVPF